MSNYEAACEIRDAIVSLEDQLMSLEDQLMSLEDQLKKSGRLIALATLVQAQGVQIASSPVVTTDGSTGVFSILSLLEKLEMDAEAVDL